MGINFLRKTKLNGKHIKLENIILFGNYINYSKFRENV